MVTRSTFTKGKGKCKGMGMGMGMERLRRVGLGGTKVVVVQA